MPTLNNITVSPGNGTGNTTLTISAVENTGRDSRSANFKANGTGSYDNIPSANSLIVTQSGKPSFINVSTTSNTESFPASGGTIVFSGTSNMQTLSIGTSGTLGTLDDLLTSATVDGVSVTKSQLQSGYTVPGDPGKTAAYNVSLTYTIPANSTSPSVPVTYSGKVGNQTISVTQASAAVVGTLAIGLDGNTTGNKNATVDADGNITSSGTYSVVASDQNITWELVEEN